MKCPFCSDPCGNEHCPYNEDQEKEPKCAIIIKGLEEENKRLKDHIIELIRWLSK